MRRLKFRVWNKKIKTWLVWFTLRDDGTILDSNLNGVYENWQEDCVIEQATGVEDKNGTMIYQGDIVKFVVGDKAYVREVIKEPILACFMLIKKGSSTPYSFSEMYEMNVDEFEIVGNIHENLELLRLIDD